MSDSHPSALGPASPQQPKKQLQVVVHAGPLAGKGFPITGGKVTFGRDPENDIFWDDSLVSRNHAQLYYRGEQLVLEDLGSTNGTLVNGNPITGQHLLQPADIISIGSSVFGIKGFSAPQTIGMTQLSTAPPPVQAAAPVVQSVPRPASAPVQAPPPPVVQSEGRSFNMLAIGGILFLIAAIFILTAMAAYFLFQQGQDDNVVQIPVVIITAPVDNSQVPLSLPVTIQATASDPSGVVRMELWVDGVQTADAVSPSAEGQATLTASMQWVPVTPGNHRLEVRAYNTKNVVSEPTVITVNAVGEEVESTPTFTPVAETSTPVGPTIPSLLTLTDLNVRSGPGTVYDLLGLLPSGSTAEIIGRDPTLQWWQIRFEPAVDRVGWVSADPAFSQAAKTDNIPLVPAPPTPTGTPTETPTPTNTPIPPTETHTPVIPTETPTEIPTETPTPTITPEGETFLFTANPTTIEGGGCSTIRWSVTGVKEVYYKDEGVGGTGDQIECPKDKETYKLRVIRIDGSERIEEVTVDVINPISSGGTLLVDPGESVDFDKGDIPGNDFAWTINGGSRMFEALSGVELSPQKEEDALSALTLATCTSADYSTYTFIDGSDGVPDIPNELISRRTACFRTNEGRLGKMRFPAYSTGTLAIEWLTWKQ